jgi:hypothetical protein
VDAGWWRHLYKDSFRILSSWFSSSRSTLPTDSELEQSIFVGLEPLANREFDTLVSYYAILAYREANRGRHPRVRCAPIYRQLRVQQRIIFTSSTTSGVWSERNFDLVFQWRVLFVF